MFKIIFSDIDGTLLNENRDVSTYTIETVKKTAGENSVHPHFFPDAGCHETFAEKNWELKSSRSSATTADSSS